MTGATEILEASRRRADALAARDAEALLALLHPAFRWTSHRGETFGREEYVERNTGGAVPWRGQALEGAEVIVDDTVAVLCAVAVDEIGERVFRMPMTQTWVRGEGGWRLLAGHAGPLLEPGEEGV